MRVTLMKLSLLILKEGIAKGTEATMIWATAGADWDYAYPVGDVIPEELI